MNLYLIRHGETHGNAAKCVQGWSEVDLNEKGKMQIAETKRLIQGLTFERIFSSDLRRTRTTSEILFGKDAEITFDERLREFDNTIFAGVPTAELRATYGEKFTSSAPNFDLSAFGGESVMHFMCRASDFLNDIARLSDECGYDKKNLVAVTHAGVIRAMVTHILRTRPNTKNLIIPNGSITLLKYRDGVWTVQFINYTGNVIGTNYIPIL